MKKHVNLLFSDINLFNKKLYKYLHWYNFKRIHQRFDNKITPFKRHLIDNGRGPYTNYFTNKYLS